MNINLIYLGIFADIFNWIINKILKPVFTFIADLLSTVIGWLFDKILAPLIQVIILPIVKWLIEVILKLLATFFYKILVALLHIIDVLQIGFDILIGSRPIKYNGKCITLLELLFVQETITTVFWCVTIISVVLLFAFTIYSVAKSAADFDLEGKKPVPLVLRKFMEGFVKLFFLPIFSFLMIYLGGAIMFGITVAFNQSGSTSIASQIFLTASMNAANPDGKFSGYQYKPEFRSHPSMDDGLRKLYTTNQVSFSDQETSVGIAQTYSAGSKDPGLFNVTEIDYIMGYIISIAVIIFMAMCLLFSVSRVFEIIILYVVSPLFVSTYPLDDGERYKKWRDKYMAKIFGSYGGFIAMKVYLVVSAVIMDSKIDFGFGGEGETMLMKLIILVGGAWSVYKAFNMLSYLFDRESAEEQGASMRKVGQGAAKAYNKAIKEPVQKSIAKTKEKMKQARQLRKKEKAERKQGSGQHFNDMKAQYGKKSDVSTRGKAEGAGGNEETGKAAAGGAPSGGGPKGGNPAAPAAAGSSERYFKGQKVRSKGLGTESRYMGLKKETYNEAGALEKEKFGLLGIVKRQTDYERDKDGKLVMDKNGKPIKKSSTMSILGGLVKVKKNSDGSFGGISLFGGAIKVNKDKNSTGVSILGIGGSKGKDGSSSFNFWNMVKTSRDSSGTRDVNVLNAFSMAKNSSGQVQRFGLLGFKSERFGEGENSRLKLTSALGGKYKMHYSADQDGKITKAFTQRNRWIDGSSTIYIAKGAPVDASADVNSLSQDTAAASNSPENTSDNSVNNVSGLSVDTSRNADTNRSRIQSMGENDGSRLSTFTDDSTRSNLSDSSRTDLDDGQSTIDAKDSDFNYISPELQESVNNSKNNSQVASGETNYNASQPIDTSGKKEDSDTGVNGAFEVANENRVVNEDNNTVDTIGAADVNDNAENPVEEAFPKQTVQTEMAAADTSGNESNLSTNGDGDMPTDSFTESNNNITDNKNNDDNNSGDNDGDNGGNNGGGGGSGNEAGAVNDEDDNPLTEKEEETARAIEEAKQITDNQSSGEGSNPWAVIMKDAERSKRNNQNKN